VEVLGVVVKSREKQGCHVIPESWFFPYPISMTEFFSGIFVSSFLSALLGMGLEGLDGVGMEYCLLCFSALSLARGCRSWIAPDGRSWCLVSGVRACCFVGL
jgi:hypothetical protein